MKIYLQEIKDGIGPKIEAQSSIAYTSEISPVIIDHLNIDYLAALVKDDNLALASVNLDNADLFYLKSILVSTGWNLNDDVFMAEELWKARKTPEHKQFNFMHDDNDIIGHITSNQVAAFDGSLLVDSDDITEIPQNFNIITNAVIYKLWTDADKRSRINKLIAEIKQNKWFVSMECFFPRFDYALQNSQGEIRLIEREESSAFLTKHLRAYGGSGVYEEYKVGRILRDLIFSGKGLVNRPANPRSVILQEQDDEAIAYANEQEIEMPDPENKELNQVKSELVDVKAELITAKSTISQLDKTVSELEAVKAELTTKNETVASLTTEKKELEVSVAKLTATLAEITEAKNALAQRLLEVEIAAKTEKRKIELVKAGVGEGELEDALASFTDMSDTAFAKMVAVMLKNKPQESVVDDDASAESLETVEETVTTTASVTETEEEDSGESLRAAAISFFDKTLASARR